MERENIPSTEAELKAFEKKKKLEGILGIAKKAGKTVIGTELVVAGIRSGGEKKCAVAVFVAGDASANTVKRIQNCCEYYEVPSVTLSLTAEELGRAVGKQSSVACVGILDSGLADAIAAKNRAAEHIDK